MTSYPHVASLFFIPLVDRFLSLFSFQRKKKESWKLQEDNRETVRTIPLPSQLEPAASSCSVPLRLLKNLWLRRITCSINCSADWTSPTPCPPLPVPYPPFSLSLTNTILSLVNASSRSNPNEIPGKPGMLVDKSRARINQIGGRVEKMARHSFRARGRIFIRRRPAE